MAKIKFSPSPHRHEDLNELYSSRNRYRKAFWLALAGLIITTGIVILTTGIIIQGRH